MFPRTSPFPTGFPSWGEGRAGAILPDLHRHPRVSTQECTGLDCDLFFGILHFVTLAESRRGGPGIICVFLPCAPGVQASAWGLAVAVLGGVRSATITYEPVTSAASILLCPPHTQGLSGPLARKGHPPRPLCSQCQEPWWDVDTMGLSPVVPGQEPPLATDPWGE